MGGKYITFGIVCVASLFVFFALPAIPCQAEQPAPPSYSKSWDSIGPGFVVFQVDNPDIAFTQVVMNVTAETKSVRIEVYKEETRSFGTEEPAGVVYQYVYVVEGSLDGRIFGAAVNFRVDDSWMSANRIDQATISLNRYSIASKKWESFSASEMSRDSGFTYYTAVVPSLSEFSISGLRLPECSAGGKRCNATFLLSCSNGEWSAAECENGCDPASLSCVRPAAVCVSGETRCSEGILQGCAPGGTGWTTIETCKSGCAGGACASPFVPAQSNVPFVVNVAVTVMIILFFAVIVLMVVLVHMNLTDFFSGKKGVT
jgi:PGF-pre-PGF domain-containing protein